MDISNAESAWLRATNMFEKWKAEFETGFKSPVTETGVNLVMRKLQALPPELQKMSRERNPQAWGVIDKNVRTAEKRKARYGNS